VRLKLFAIQCTRQLACVLLQSTVLHHAVAIDELLAQLFPAVDNIFYRFYRSFCCVDKPYFFYWNFL